MAAQHTPGPWKCDGKIVAWADPDIISIIATTDIGGSDGQTQRANARLIAAAPDLLAILVTFVNERIELAESGDAGFWHAEEDESVKAARAVIAKVEGR